MRRVSALAAEPTLPSLAVAVLFLLLGRPAPTTAHLSAFCTVTSSIHRDPSLPSLPAGRRPNPDCGGGVPCSTLYPNGTSITTVWLGTYHTDPIAHSNGRRMLET